MSRRSAPVARSAAAERTLTTLLGLLAAAGGTAVLLVGAGTFGTARADRPLVDPIAVDAITRNRVLALVVGMAAGIILAVFGMWWALRSLRPEPRPDVVLDRSPATALTVAAAALADAVLADAETVTGVDRARVRLVGHPGRPGLRLSLWLREGADVREVWSELDSRVLARARESLGIDPLPTAVRIELDTAARQRVS